MPAAYARFIEALESNGFKYKPDGRGRARAQCPGHNGDDLNLAIAVGDQGVLLRCHAYDCPADDIARALGMRLSDLFDSDGKAVYDYGGGHKVERYRTREGKSIVQKNHPGPVTQLYRHPDSQPIESAELVVIVEGEKSVDAALRLGLPCVTTWPGGAGAVDHVNIDPLAGKRVRIIADNDEPGRAAAAHLALRLEGLATVENIYTAPTAKQGIDDIWLDGGELSDLVPLNLDAYMEAEKGPEPTRVASVKKLKGVQSRKPRYLWEGKLPYGALILFGGKGGTGKSSFALWLAGLITKGEMNGHLMGQPSAVLYVSHEDSLEEVIVPRAIANGVDLDLFYQVGVASKLVEGVSVPRLPDDMPIIRDAIKQTNAKVIIIDPITSTIGGDNDKMADVRRVLDPLNQLGQELGVTVIAIAHFKKGGGSQSDMVSGSHAYRDASRAVLLFAKEESMSEDGDDNPPTVITLDKSNAGQSGQSWSYRTDVIKMLMDDGQEGVTTKVTWMGQSKRSVGEIINTEQAGGQQGVLAQAIKAYLDSQAGAVTTKEIQQAFSDSKPTTVSMTLNRLRGRGMVDQPAFGLWQSMKHAPADRK